MTVARIFGTFFRPPHPSLFFQLSLMKSLINFCCGSSQHPTRFTLLFIYIIIGCLTLPRNFYPFLNRSCCFPWITVHKFKQCERVLPFVFLVKPYILLRTRLLPLSTVTPHVICVAEVCLSRRRVIVNSFPPFPGRKKKPNSEYSGTITSSGQTTINNRFRAVLRVRRTFMRTHSATLNIYTVRNVPITRF